MRFLSLILLLVASLNAETILREDFATDPRPRGWRTFGDNTLFAWNPGKLAATWDSSKTNSYFYLPLPFAIDSADSFQLSFELILNDIAVGTTPGKQYTFELGIALFNEANATNSTFFRGSGVDALHGGKDLIEFNYFPDSGFGATIAPTITSSANRIFFSDNHPYELTPEDLFRVTISYDAAARTLTTAMRQNGDSFPPEGLRSLTLPEGQTFLLDAAGIMSYSDAGQNPPQFSGSLLAHGQLDNIEIRLPDPPVGKLSLAKQNDLVTVTFASRSNWRYQLERSTNLKDWDVVMGVFNGGPVQTILSDQSPPLDRAYYRVEASKAPAR